MSFLFLHIIFLNTCNHVFSNVLENKRRYGLFLGKKKMYSQILLEASEKVSHDLGLGSGYPIVLCLTPPTSYLGFSFKVAEKVLLTHHCY